MIKNTILTDRQTDRQDCNLTGLACQQSEVMLCHF